MFKFKTMLLSLLVMGFFSGCASPFQRLDEQADKLGFIKQIIPGTDYIHIVYLNAAGDKPVPYMSILRATELPGLTVLSWQMIPLRGIL